MTERNASKESQNKIILPRWWAIQRKTKKRQQEKMTWTDLSTGTKVVYEYSQPEKANEERMGYYIVGMLKHPPSPHLPLHEGQFCRLFKMRATTNTRRRDNVAELKTANFVLHTQETTVETGRHLRFCIRWNTERFQTENWVLSLHNFPRCEPIVLIIWPGTQTPIIECTIERRHTYDRNTETEC